MPELPEIETIKLQLAKYLPGRRLLSVEKLHPKSLQGNPKLVIGKTITEVRRLGKMLVIDLEKNLHLAIHFKMTGQLILDQKSKIKSQNDKKLNLKNRIVGGHPTEDWIKPLPSKHTRVVFTFNNGRMYFNDQRLFGWVEVNSKIKNQRSKMWKYIENLGPEPWDVTDEQFFQLIKKCRKAVKLAIMDQTVISGVGNIYANDGLWEAHIHPSCPAEKLGKKEIKELRNGLIKVLKEGIKYGGATASDAKYMNLDGLGGHYQEHFRVYDRQGQKCLRGDSGVIKKIVLGGRGTYFCPVCQKL